MSSTSTLVTTPTQTCPLCGGQAHTSAGAGSGERALLSCHSCRAFVIDWRLIDVIANARSRNVSSVLRHLTGLTTAAQSAAARGTVLLITSTNWIRLALGHTRITESPVESRGGELYARSRATAHARVSRRA